VIDTAERPAASVHVGEQSAGRPSSSNVPLGSGFLHDALEVPCRHDRAELTPRPLAGCPAEAADDEVASRHSSSAGSFIGTAGIPMASRWVRRSSTLTDSFGMGVLHQKRPGVTSIDVDSLTVDVLHQDELAPSALTLPLDALSSDEHLPSLSLPLLALSIEQPVRRLLLTCRQSIAMRAG
jgi:hypothetical protein